MFVVDCLDQCERSNVVVVRAAGERTWFGEMLDDTSVALFAEWLTGDGVGAVPAALEAHRFDPDARPLGQMEMDARSGAELVEWAHELVAGGGWIVGVPGGVVEVHAGDGAVPLLLTDDTRAFTIVGPREPAVPVVIVFAAIIAVPGNGIPALPLGLQIPKGFVVRAVHFPTA